MNRILEVTIEKRGGHYCHVFEVDDVSELENIAEAIYSEWEFEATNDEIIEFLESATVISLNEANEDIIHDFSFAKYVEEVL